MNDNERFFQLYETLKDQGRIKTYVQLAEILGTNKAGINDLKSGRKKITTDNLRSMIKSYSDVSADWLLTGEGEMLKKQTFTDSNTSAHSSHEKAENVESALIKEITKQVLRGQIDALKQTASVMQLQLEAIEKR